jgi:hypothetical protein
MMGATTDGKYGIFFVYFVVSLGWFRGLSPGGGCGFFEKCESFQVDCRVVGQLGNKN